MSYKIIDIDIINKGNHDFIREESEHEQDFIINNRKQPERGIFFSNNFKTYIFLKNHVKFAIEHSPKVEDIIDRITEDIIETCVHESLHVAIYHCSMWEDVDIDSHKLKEDEGFHIDDLQEHIIIDNLLEALSMPVAN